MLQSKKRVGNLNQKRNELRVGSLGDKSYRYPDYSPDFFKEEGLVSGSTSFRLRPTQNIDLNP